MSGMRRPVVVKRQAAGFYDANGRWQEGTTSQLTMMASVQPLKVSEMQALPEGRRSSSAVKVYTDTLLLRAEEETAAAPAQNPDIITWQSRTYEVVDCLIYQSGIIPHYKALAVEVRQT